ncbi:hypothetical protein CCE01nite_19220 [Cellulomonas cellasea]|uniref:Uncharacterized protein n=1 Tax=Cellulomonas cellasea TaxID=43670 RepID=A0A4Y3KV99_9CELL|nr:hypothetical protein CCE01nite_19220 [Cellulomonas cellasea]
MEDSGAEDPGVADSGTDGSDGSGAEDSGTDGSGAESCGADGSGAALLTGRSFRQRRSPRPCCSPRPGRPSS